MLRILQTLLYAKDYETCTKEAKERIDNAPIKEKLNDISEYEVIYIMSPIYWGTYAPEIETAIKDLDFTGKIIRIVTTHEGSGLANVVNDIKRICPNANVLDDAIAIVGRDAKNARSIIEKWIG